MNVNVNITHRNSPMRINNQDNIFEKKFNNKKNILESPKNKKTNKFLLVICAFQTLSLHISVLFGVGTWNFNTNCVINKHSKGLKSKCR